MTEVVPLPAGMHALFVVFEGVTITLGDCDDSKTNCSSLVAQGSTTVPPFLMAETNRQTRITAIKGMVQDALARFSVDVVTTRPTKGDYWMVVAGGTSDAIAGAPGALLAASPVCEATNRNSVALVFEGLARWTRSDHAVGRLHVHRNLVRARANVYVGNQRSDDARQRVLAHHAERAAPADDRRRLSLDTRRRGFTAVATNLHDSQNLNEHRALDPGWRTSPGDWFWSRAWRDASTRIRSRRTQRP